MKKIFKRTITSLITALVLVMALAFAYLIHLESYQSNQEPSSNQWQQTSKQTAYPNPADHPHMWILVSKRQQRVYLIDHGKVLYRMYASTGSGQEKTPSGIYHIQAERGLSFYNAKSGEGAKYWVSWKNHGEYLFHSVPTDAHGKYLISEADKLGKTAASHGCVRLSVPDARWFYQNIPQNTRVVISPY